MDHVRHLAHQNRMLRSKLEKTAQALSFYEKENAQLRFRLSGSETARSSTSSTGMPLSNRSTSHEIETLRAKLQKHEQLRVEMIRTVDSLKRQHQQLTQAILSNSLGNTIPTNVAGNANGSDVQNANTADSAAVEESGSNSADGRQKSSASAGLRPSVASFGLGLDLSALQAGNKDSQDMSMMDE